MSPREAGQQDHPEGPAELAAASQIERALGGDLPCAVCAYNLRGLSIVSVCPECGCPVRATILAVVDPYARELEPIPAPRVVAAGIVAWSACALSAAALAWIPHLQDLLALLFDRRGPEVVPTIPIMLLVICSGLGAFVLVRPHAGVELWRSLLAATGVLLYIPLCLTIWWIHSEGPASVSYLAHWPPPTERVLLRLLLGALIVAIVLCLRANARTLVARSLLLRSGRVDRQTLVAIAGAAIVAGIGDAVILSCAGLQGAPQLVARIVAVGLIATGSVLITMGLAGATADSWRIARSIVRPGPTLESLLERRGEAHP